MQTIQNTWNVQDAKNHFCELVASAVNGEPQFVTKRGTPSVVVLSASAYEQFEASRKPNQFLSALMDGEKVDDWLIDENISREPFSAREVQF